MDVDAPSLAAASSRCEAHEADVEFVVANATELGTLLDDRDFDFVIFFACLEHLTHEERLLAMATTWEMLKPGALWCVIETPNRLWYLDAHTSLLPFYHWLPDDLAVKYSQFSPRDSLRGAFSDAESVPIEYLRLGRGVSYREFNLALGDTRTLDVVSSLTLHLRQQSRLRRVAAKRNIEFLHETVLRRTGPKIHPGFFQSILDLIIRKH